MEQNENTLSVLKIAPGQYECHQRIHLPQVI